MTRHNDLLDAIRLTLESDGPQGTWLLCRQCGAVKHSLDLHVCRVGPVEAEGLVVDEKKRAKSYVVV